jgi:hypothetical protein
MSWVQKVESQWVLMIKTPHPFQFHTHRRRRYLYLYIYIYIHIYIYILYIYIYIYSVSALGTVARGHKDDTTPCICLLGPESGSCTGVGGGSLLRVTVSSYD